MNEQELKPNEHFATGMAAEIITGHSNCRFVASKERANPPKKPDDGEKRTPPTDSAGGVLF
jgi:hypothetical protein